MNNSGFVKLHRKCTEWEWFSTPGMFRLFFYLISKANYKNGRYKGHEVPRGSCITGIHALSKQTGISVKRIRTCLSRLENTGEITRKRASKFSIISICNYSTYQDMETQEGQAMGKQGASKGQHLKKEKKEKKTTIKNTKKKYGTFENVLLTEIDYQKILNRFNGSAEERINNLSEYVESTGKKYKSHYATILAWARREEKKPARGQPRATTVHQEGIIQRNALAQQILQVRENGNNERTSVNDNGLIEHKVS